MARQGSLMNKDGQHFVNIDVTHTGTRYHFEGPRRQDVAKAQEDLTYIYSAATTGVTRGEGLQAMKAALTGTKPFEGTASIRILVPQIIYLSELGPWSAMVGDGLRRHIYLSELGPWSAMEQKCPNF